MVTTIKHRIAYIFLLFPFFLSAQPPVGYYNAAVGKTEAALKTAIGKIVGPHTERTYDNLWTDFQKTDKRPDGRVLDIYSCTTNYIFVTNQCGNYSGEGSCYNREHSFPKSWFNDATPMYSDLFHLYPSDGYVNGRRGNDPFGEVGTVSYASQNNYSKSGTCSFPGYTGRVFEPTDTLKGDFARTYFYMVTAYDDRVASWVSDQLAGNQYPALSAWSVAMFLKWHRQDPVGPKERSRNNAVYGIQNNRNPFIDYPELAEYIWGTKKGSPWSLTASVPELKFAFGISPNPVQNQLTIKCTENNLEFKVLSISGQVLKQGQLGDERIINLAALNNGMYFLQLKAGNKTATQKFILSH